MRLPQVMRIAGLSLCLCQSVSSAQTASTTVHLGSSPVAIGSLSGTLVFRLLESGAIVRVKYFWVDGSRISDLWRDEASLRAETEVRVLPTEHRSTPDDSLVVPLIVALEGKDARAALQAMNAYMVGTGSPVNMERQKATIVQATLLGEIDASGPTPKLKPSVRILDAGTSRELPVADLSRKGQ